MPALTDSLRGRLRHAFSGDATGTPPWIRDLEDGEDAGFFGPGSATWTVHRGIPTIVAGIRALLLQALHPGALAGVHDHSRFREDPLGRLAGTVRWVTTVTYGSREQATAASRWVSHLHRSVHGQHVDNDGALVDYSAADPELLAWVHEAFADSFLSVHEIWGGPIPGGPDAYVSEWARAGELMGVAHPPRTAAELRASLRRRLDERVLRRDERVDEVVRFLRQPPLPGVLGLGYPLLVDGAVSSLPPEFRSVLGVRPLRPTVQPWATGGVLGLIGALLGDTPAAEHATRRRLERLSRDRPSGA